MFILDEEKKRSPADHDRDRNEQKTDRRRVGVSQRMGDLCWRRTV